MDRKKFNVVIPMDGGIQMYPMKAWLRQHPEHLPEGCDPTEWASHALRNALKKKAGQFKKQIQRYFLECLGLRA